MSVNLLAVLVTCTVDVLFYIWYATPRIWTQLQSTVSPQGATEQHTCTHALIESPLWETPPKLHCHQTMEFQQGQNYMYCILLCCGDELYKSVLVCIIFHSQFQFNFRIENHLPIFHCLLLLNSACSKTAHALQSPFPFLSTFVPVSVSMSASASVSVSPSVSASEPSRTRLFPTYPVKQLMSTLLNHPAVWCCVPIG